MSATIQQSARYPRSTMSGLASWEGKAFGGIVLAAFLLYGIGSAAADQPLGITLVLVNSVAVAVAGLIGFRLLQASQPGVGVGYLAARVAEAIFLAGGILLTQLADVNGADNAGYLLAMIALAVGSVPFCRTLGHEQWLPPRLALWGVLGYVALATGAALELATDRSLAVYFAVPGGLFELALGVYLLRNGFRRRASSQLQKTNNRSLNAIPVGRTQ